jgi:hypothetical protein
MGLVYVMGVILAVVLIYLIVKPKKEAKVTIKSKFGQSGRKGVGAANPTSEYTAKLKKGRNGRNYSDWNYYDEFGNLIENIILMELLFGVFSGEDWYSDEDYYVNDVHYYENVEGGYVRDDIRDGMSVAEETPVVDDTPTEESKNEEHTFTEPEFKEPKFEEPKYEEPSFTEPSFDDDTTRNSSFGGGDSYDSGGGDFGGGDD